MTALRIAASPRSTWITTPDAECATAIRALLAGSSNEVGRRGHFDPFAFDLGIGAEAKDTSSLLLGAGYLFRWHADHPLNRSGTAWRIPVEGD